MFCYKHKDTEWEAVTAVIDNYIHTFGLPEENLNQMKENIHNREELFKHLLDDLGWVYNISKRMTGKNGKVAKKRLLKIIKYINEETSEMINE